MFRQCHSLKNHYQSVLLTLKFASLKSAAFEGAKKTSITKLIERKNPNKKVLLPKLDLVKNEHDHPFYILKVLPESEI